LPSSDRIRYIPELQEQLSHEIFNFCNNCLFVQVSNNENLIFLQVIHVLKIFVNGGLNDKHGSITGVPR